jgi:Uma2 family endonuclease
MSQQSELEPKSGPPWILESGDVMDQPTFHEIYSHMPENFRAELIDGVVYVASPLKRPHSRSSFLLISVLGQYEAQTPGVSGEECVTVILSDHAEVQPDILLRIEETFGGESYFTEDEFLTGAPELVIEVSQSSRSIDLNHKRKLYRENGIIEYLVIDLQKDTIRWFDLQLNQELQTEPDGIYRIRTFPGLWIDSSAVFDQNLARLITTLNLGLSSQEHAEFVSRLESTRLARLNPQ